MAHFPLSLERRYEILWDGATLFALYKTLHEAFDGRSMINWQWDDAPNHLRELASIDDFCSMVVSGIAHQPDDEILLEYEAKINNIKILIILPRIIRHKRMQMHRANA